MTRQKVRMSEEGQDWAIMELSQMYSTRPIYALREYVTNAIDEIYDMNETGGLVRIILDPAQSRVMIQDNAVGMTAERLAQLPLAVGTSIKRGKIDKRGEKGLGLISFGSLGERAHIITRTEGNPIYEHLLYEKGHEKGQDVILFELGKLKDIADFDEPFSHGTLVVLDVEKQKFNQKFKSSIVRSEMQEIYWPILERDDMGIMLGLRGGDESFISPPKTRGEILSEGNRKFKFKKKGEEKTGTLRYKLWIDTENPNGRVPLYSKGVRIYRHVTEIEDEYLSACGLWNCRFIRGFIDQSDLALTLGRESINEQRETNAYNAFIQELYTLNELLWPQVQGLIEKERIEKDDVSIDSAFELFKEAYQDPTLDPLSKGARSEIQITGSHYKWGIKGNGKKNRIVPFARPEHFPFVLGERHLRSKIEVRLGLPTPCINETHKDYQNIFKSDPTSYEAQEYLVRAMATPSALWESEKAVREKGAAYNTEEQRILEVARRADDLVYNAMRRLRNIR